jgi:hypothetical protein
MGRRRELPNSGYTGLLKTICLNQESDEADTLRDEADTLREAVANKGIALRVLLFIYR